MSSHEESPFRAAENMVPVRIAQRRIDMHLVQSTELDTLKSGYVSNKFTLFGIGTGALFSLMTMSIGLKFQSGTERAMPWCWIGTAFAAILTIVFGLDAWRARRDANKLIDKIKDSEKVEGVVAISDMGQLKDMR
jgi:hypothetical protein